VVERDNIMAKKQTDALTALDAELATLRAREQQLQARHRTATDALLAARERRQQLILDGVDDVDALGRAAATIAEAEHRVAGCADAVSIVAQRVKQLAEKRAVEIRWAERRRISERMTKSVEAITTAWAQFQPARDALIKALDIEAAIFEIAQSAEHIRNYTGAVLELQMPVIVDELTRQAAGLLNADVLNPVGIPPLPVEPATLPQTLGKPTGPASVRPGAGEWPPDRTPHTNFPLGEIPEPKQPLSRQDLLDQQQQAMRKMWPHLYDDDDTRTAEQIFADEQARIQTK
jgi:hypothetical protein